MGDDEYWVDIPHSPQSIIQVEDAAIDLMVVLYGEYLKSDAEAARLSRSGYARLMVEAIAQKAIRKARGEK